MNWKTLPFKWNPAAYGRFDGIPEKDPTLGQSSSLEEFNEFCENGRYEATEIFDLKATCIEYAVKGLGGERAILASQEKNGEKCKRTGMVWVLISTKNFETDLSETRMKYQKYFAGQISDEPFALFHSPDEVQKRRKILATVSRLISAVLSDQGLTQFNRGSINDWDTLNKMYFNIRDNFVQEPSIMKLFGLLKSVPSLVRLGIRKQSLAVAIREAITPFFKRHSRMFLDENEGENIIFSGLDKMSPVMNMLIMLNICFT